jgi:hypothetical protein
MVPVEVFGGFWWCLMKNSIILINFERILKLARFLITLLVHGVVLCMF